MVNTIPNTSTPAQPNPPGDAAQPAVPLTDAEADVRRRAGEGNNVTLVTSRSLGGILRANLFTTLNMIIITIGVILVALGRVGDGVFSAGMVVFNVAIGVIQEWRAKQQLDQINLLNHPQVVVVRRMSSGADEERTVDPAEIVKGDLIRATTGDQIVVDGKLVGDGQLELDESLLTGESDQVSKRAGDTVRSGSICVSGNALYCAEQVGANSYAAQLTTQARKFRAVKTPLQRQIDFALGVLITIAIALGILEIVYSVISEMPFTSSVQAASVIVGIVPQGLFVAVLVSYSLGAVRISRQGALVQQTNAVESLSNIDVLCTDKTGTLTANQLKFGAVLPLGGADAGEIERALGIFTHSAHTSNKTSEAIGAVMAGAAAPTLADVPFSSARKWSALAFDEPLKGAYVLGAYEMMKPALAADTDHASIMAQIKVLSDQGYRVLLFAHQADPGSLKPNTDADAVLPENLVPHALVQLSDVLRTDARETLQHFIAAGVQPKIISGDNPDTVAALAKLAGLTGDLKLVSGTDLAAMSETALDQAASDSTIFGRITPEQKERLVDALKRRGHYVAMMGDGVNDVLSLKKADLGIAMQSGTPATRNVADIVLLKDSFAALVPALLEGQRIVNGMRNILSLFLARCFTVALVIVAVGYIGLGFPFVPRNITLLTLFTVGIPSLMLTWSAQPGPTKGNVVFDALRFALPAAFLTAIFALIVFALTFALLHNSLLQADLVPSKIDAFRRAAGIGREINLSTQARYAFAVGNATAQTVVTVFLLLTGLMLVMFIEPPIKLLAVIREYHGARWPLVLVLLSLIGFGAVWVFPPTRGFFGLAVAPDPLVIGGLLAFTAVWSVLLAAAWNHNWLTRLLRIYTQPGAASPFHPIETK